MGEGLDPGHRASWSANMAVLSAPALLTNRARASSAFLGLAQYRAEHGNAGKANFHSAER
jgi:hypothetical protein